MPLGKQNLSNTTIGKNKQTLQQPCKWIRKEHIRCISILKSDQSFAQFPTGASIRSQITLNKHFGNVLINLVCRVTFTHTAPPTISLLKYIDSLCHHPNPSVATHKHVLLCVHLHWVPPPGCLHGAPHAPPTQCWEGERTSPPVEMKPRPSYCTPAWTTSLAPGRTISIANKTQTLSYS